MQQVWVSAVAAALQRRAWPLTLLMLHAGQATKDTATVTYSTIPQAPQRVETKPGFAVSHGQCSCP